MHKYSVEDVVAERNLEYRVSEGETLPGRLRIGRPVQVQDEEWVCPYEVTAGDKTKSGGMHGVDSMQSLILSLKTLDVEIAYLSKKLGAGVFFLDGGHRSVFHPTEPGELDEFLGGPS